MNSIILNAVINHTGAKNHPDTKRLTQLLASKLKGVKGLKMSEEDEISLQTIIGQLIF